MESSGQTESFIVNMAVYIFALLVFLVVIIGILLLKNFEKLKPKLTKIIEGVKEKTFWNNTIRSVTITYIETAI